MTSTPLRGLRVAVAGAGAVGLSVAVRAAQSGAEVVVFDPAARGDNASGVAAGMLSPALETVLEGGDSARYALYRQAYAAWPEFTATLHPAVAGHREGVLQVGEASTLEALAKHLSDLGVETRSLVPEEVAAVQPLYGGDCHGLFVAEDGRLNPGAMLDALSEALLAAGGRLIAERLGPGGPPTGFDRLVVATGYDARAWLKFVPELDVLAPIKGHILHYALTGRGGATLRGDGGYLAPQPDRVVFGATMEPGRGDRAVDPATGAELHHQAVVLAPALKTLPWIARTGVRASTPDALPMVGASASGAAILAVGARRNGWLLAPLIADDAVAALAGEPPRPAFDPVRFAPA